MIFDVQSAGGGTRQAQQGGLSLPWAFLSLSGGLDVGTAPVALEAILSADNNTSGTGGKIEIRSPTRLLALMSGHSGPVDMIEPAGTHDHGIALC